jgi:iron complex outermembrane receptor protein
MKKISSQHQPGRNIRRSRLGDAVIVAIAGYGACAGNVDAQEADAKTLDNIVVTGTRKTGMQIDDSPAPVQVVTAETLQQTGQPDLMNQLAFQVPSFNASQQGTDMTSATLVASMRALSPNHTLILVDGKRRHFTSNVAVLGSWAGAASTDLSFIPSSAISSIEVLTDGAAALYGSDAIAGVINIITKKNSNGGSVRATVGGYDGGGGLSKNYQGNFGFSNENGYVNLSLESERRESVNRHGEPYGPAACIADELADGSCSATRAAGTTASGYASSSGNTGRPSAAMVEAGYPTEFLKNEYNMVYHPWYPYNQHQGDPPELERDIGYISAGWFLDNGAEIYANGSFGRKETISSQSYRRPAQDGGYDANGDGDRNDQLDDGTWEADINKYPLGFNPNIESDETDFSIGVGITGDWIGWNYDLSTNYGRNEMEIYNTNSMNFSLWNEYGFSPDSFYVGRFEASQWTSSVEASREFDWGLSTPVTFAAGIEYRKDTYGIGAGDEASYYGAGSAAFPGYNPLSAGDWERNNKALFVNLIFNPTENWLLDLAARYENYSDFGSETVGKITTRYDFNDHFAVRGTVSTGFRAPTMGESYYTAIQVGPSSATATVAAADVGGGLKPETSKNYSLGFVFKPLPNLTTTLDVYRIEIDDRIRMGTFDYSTSQGEDTLCGRTDGCTPDSTLPDPADTDGDGTPDDSYNQILGEALVAGGYISQWDDPTAAGGSFDPSARANISMSFFSNVLDTETTGVDWVTTYHTEFDWGRIDWILAANYNETEVTRAGRVAGFETIPIFTDADIWSIEKNSPKWRVNLGATIHFSEKLSLNIQENVYGPQSSISSASAYLNYPDILQTMDLVTINGATYYKLEIDTLFTTNVELTYKPKKGLSLSIGADNLFDEYPDETPEGYQRYLNERYGFTSSRNYILGSPIGYYGTRWYAKATYDW